MSETDEKPVIEEKVESDVEAQDSGAEDSDSSIATDELNEIQSQLKSTYSEPEIEKPKPKPKPKVKGKAPIKPPPEKPPPVKKPKGKGKVVKLPEPETQAEVIEEPVVEEVKPKKRMGRPPKSLEEKLAKQVIVKEKLIYVIQDPVTGNMVRKDASKMGKMELKKLQQQQEHDELEIKYGRSLAKLKNGKTKLPRERTEAQKAATLLLVERNKIRRAEQKKQKEQKQKDDLKEAVTQSVVEVVSRPAIKVQPQKPPEKTIDERYKDFFS